MLGVLKYCRIALGFVYTQVRPTHHSGEWGAYDECQADGFRKRVNATGSTGGSGQVTNIDEGEYRVIVRVQRPNRFVQSLAVFQAPFVTMESLFIATENVRNAVGASPGRIPGTANRAYLDG